MKKIVVLTLCCIWGVLSMSAQSNELNQKELQFRNGIERILKQKGFNPTIDNDDNSLNWEDVDGQKYWLTVKGDRFSWLPGGKDDPFFIILHLGGFSMEDVNEELALEACNYANMNQRCGKAAVDGNSIVFTAEYYCYSLKNFQDTISRYMSALNSTKGAVSSYYNEHEE